MCKAVAEFYDGQLPLVAASAEGRWRGQERFLRTVQAGVSDCQADRWARTNTAIIPGLPCSGWSFSRRGSTTLLALGLSQEQIDAAHGFYTLHQDVMRGNIRVPEGTEEVCCVVPACRQRRQKRLSCLDAPSSACPITSSRSGLAIKSAVPSRAASPRRSRPGPPAQAPTQAARRARAGQGARRRGRLNVTLFPS